MKKNSALTTQQEAFARSLAEGKTKAEAYRLAYPKAKAWPATTLNPRASRLARKCNIVTRVEELLAALEEKTLVSAAKVICEVARIAFFDVRRLVHENGKPKSLHDIDDDTAAAISGLDVSSVGNDEIGVGEILKFKISDKNSALDKLCRHLGLYKPEEKPLGDTADTIMAMNNANTALLHELLRGVKNKNG